MIKIGDFAALFNVSIKTIRFYEEKGLLKPKYVDNYTGYRYFDQENIDDMMNILFYKDLGFGLSEIKDLDKEAINSKIKEYKDKVVKMKKNINTLNSLLMERGIDNVKPFMVDENAIGKWVLIGMANSKEDFLNNKTIDDSDLRIRELYLMSENHNYWVIDWTKGSIYFKDSENPYEIIDNKMFVTIKGLEGEEVIAVYEKVDNKDYDIEEIKTKDNLDIPFNEDNKLLGQWQSVQYVRNENLLDEKEFKEDLFVKNMSVFSSGEVVVLLNNSNVIKSSYTNGFIKEFCAKESVSKYYFKTIKDSEYLFVEWKSGDYTFGRQVFGYYVFKKIN